MDLTILLTILGIIATIAAPAAGYIIKLRKEYKNYYSVIWKSSNKLKARELLGERPFEEYYYARSIDNQIQRSLERRRNVIIVGPPLSGKTRAFYNALKQQKSSIHLLVPRSVPIQNFQFPKDFIFWKPQMIFIDDLQYYIERQDSFHLLFREAKERGIPIAATCHSGREFKKVKNKMVEQNLDLDIIFGDDIIEMEKISADEGKLVSEKLGMKWDTVKFNGTIGSIFMRLSEMERRFDNCDNIEKTILRSLRNLYKSGIYEENSIFRLEWIKKAAGMFELEGRDFEWTGWIKNLEDKEFVKIARRNKIWAEDAYLEFVVKPEVELQQTDIFESMAEVFTDNAEVLQMIGERAYDIGIVDTKIGDYMKIAIGSFEKVLALIDKENQHTEYIKAQNYLGQSYWSLSKVQDTLVNCARSIEYFNEILKTISIESHPVEYARIKNRIGNTYTAFAEVESREENCLVAINAYNEALKVFSKRAYPQEYARAHNNLGGAYLILAEVKDKTTNYRKAIASFEEALQVEIIKESPKLYALTKNNIANTYARLSDIEDAESNLKRSIEAYNDVLALQSKEKAPLQYGLTKNNIGNAYSMLALIKDKKQNLDKAISAFEEALEVRKPEQVPIQYANTMFNLGDACLVKSELENDAEPLYRAIDAFEESMKIRTENKYPIQFAECKFGLGKAYLSLSGYEDKTENYHKAIASFDDALKIFTEDKFPENYRLLQEEISRAKKIFF
ncbi:MAG TPA: tetratricopeptide repeat protein [Ignavibacteria bacterium]|nr:tetratricopeptide repeat protein [Ignavibacteria bacterium]